MSAFKIHESCYYRKLFLRTKPVIFREKPKNFAKNLTFEPKKALFFAFNQTKIGVIK